MGRGHKPNCKMSSRGQRDLNFFYGICHKSMTFNAVLQHRPRHIRKPSPHEMFSFPPVLALLLLNSTQPMKPLRNVTPKRRAHIGHLSAVRRPRGEGPALRGLWRERRGGGRPLRPLPDARRQPGGLAAHQGYLSGRSLLPPDHTFYQLATHCTIWSHLLLTGHIFQSISAKAENGEPCCDWVGKGGSGHFVKMVHNGIEYGDMQGRN